MINLFFELERLRTTLQNKGVADRVINEIVWKARKEINEVIAQQGQRALGQAVEIGAQKRSPEFINELEFSEVTFEVDTESGRLDFSEPPKPMLPYLLKNAKPIKEGGGVYKVIPVGKPGERAKVSKSIVDAQKKILAERVEAAQQQQRAIAPAGSKQVFRTATSRQDPQTQWVQPATKKDFTEEVQLINEELTNTLDGAIYDIINGYIDMY